MMKSIKLEWCLGEIKNAHTLLQEAVKHYPDFAKVSKERERERFNVLLNDSLLLTTFTSVYMWLCIEYLFLLFM